MPELYTWHEYLIVGCATKSGKVIPAVWTLWTMTPGTAYLVLALSNQFPPCQMADIDTPMIDLTRSSQFSATSDGTGLDWTGMASRFPGAR